jgi:hypothetical protein
MTFLTELGRLAAAAEVAGEAAMQASKDTEAAVFFRIQEAADEMILAMAAVEGFAMDLLARIA